MSTEMTSTLPLSTHWLLYELELPTGQVRGAVGRSYGVNFLKTKENPEEVGYVNQSGLNRKVGLRVGVRRSLNQNRLSAISLQHIFESVEASLERLGVKYIDLLQCKWRAAAGVVREC